ncbi:MAG: ABC transporter permease subunit, partial [Verrucomicrobiales bacterium]|nr:ABC transporter permease subunit [Verrucomicrobiales bacterium]
MTGLMWKEFMALRAFFGLVVGLFFFFVLLTLATEFPDEQTLEIMWESPAEIASVFGVIALIVSMGLLVREREEGTLGFLDALPVTRVRVFWAKWLVALGILWFDLLLSVGELLV